MSIECCSKPMEQFGIYLHCMGCKKTRLIEFPYGSERKIVSNLILEYVQEYEPTWKEFQKTIHELWKAGYYENYEPDIPKEWYP